MTDNAQRQVSARSRGGAVEPAAEPAAERLRRVLARVRDDALERPREYARETVVPDGGE